MLNTFNSAYNMLHLLMGYDGELDTKVCKAGLEKAEQIIHWVETKQETN